MSECKLCKWCKMGPSAAPLTVLEAHARAVSPEVRIDLNQTWPALLQNWSSVFWAFSFCCANLLEADRCCAGEAEQQKIPPLLKRSLFSVRCFASFFFLVTFQQLYQNGVEVLNNWTDGKNEVNRGKFW